MEKPKTDPILVIEYVSESMALIDKRYLHNEKKRKADLTLTEPMYILEYRADGFYQAEKNSPSESYPQLRIKYQTNIY